MPSQTSNETHGKPAEEKTLDKPPEEKTLEKSTKDSLVVTAFQTACLAIIVLLAKFVGDFLYNAIISKSFTGQLPFLILVSTLSFLEIINNWASIKKYFGLYNTPLFLIDVLTLGAFFWQVYILSKLESELKSAQIDPQNEMILVVMVSYGIIFILYILWNAFFLAEKGCHSAEERDENIKKIILPAGIRLLQTCWSLGFVLFGVDRVPMLAFDAFVFLSCLYVLRRNWKLDIFSTIIASKNAV